MFSLVTGFFSTGARSRKLFCASRAPTRSTRADAMRAAGTASEARPATGKPGGNGRPSADALTLLDEQQRPRPKLRLHSVSGEVSGSNPLALLSWQPKRADAVWSRQEWTALCKHLHNDNPQFHYVMGFNKEGEVRYVRAKSKPVSRSISWAWTSITGTARSKLAFIPYSTNEHQLSRWGGLDFDAHDGNADRARELALAAFRVLLNAPDLCVVLETSGSGGWHVWAISPDFHATADWIRLLKGVVRTTGASVASGVVEIFPPDSMPSRFGRGMRAPGCWNPRTDRCSEIVWENTRSSLGLVLSGNRKTAPLVSNDLESQFPDIERNLSFSSSLYRSRDFLQRHGITAPSTRNGRLVSLVGEVFHQVGHATARALAEEQYRSKTVSTKASELEHLASFEKLWEGLTARWTGELSEAERESFATLGTENEKDAFRILRSYARKAERDGSRDFPVARDNLASRLGIITKTADYSPNKVATRFKWAVDAAGGEGLTHE